MGFDLCGRGPRGEAGKYFGANVSAWPKLAETCLRVAPDICSQVEEKFWFSNDGRGLDDAGAIALADALDRAIETDRLKYEDALSGQLTAEDRFLRTFSLRTVAGSAMCFRLPKDPGSSIVCET